MAGVKGSGGKCDDAVVGLVDGIGRWMSGSVWLVGLWGLFVRRISGSIWVVDLLGPFGWWFLFGLNGEPYVVGLNSGYVGSA